MILTIKMEVSRNLNADTKFLKDKKRMLKKILLIFDECTSGFERLWWSQII